MTLTALPTIDRLVLARVTRVPEWHPERATFEPFPVHAWVVRHPDGAILVDTGIGGGNDNIDTWYSPEVIALDEALASIGLTVNGINAVVLSHLHFDHCGQQRMLTCPVYVQAAEHRAAERPRYTIPEWQPSPTPASGSSTGIRPSPMVCSSSRRRATRPATSPSSCKPGDDASCSAQVRVPRRRSLHR